MILRNADCEFLFRFEQSAIQPSGVPLANVDYRVPFKRPYTHYRQQTIALGGGLYSQPVDLLPPIVAWGVRCLTAANRIGMRWTTAGQPENVTHLNPGQFQWVERSFEPGSFLVLFASPNVVLDRAIAEFVLLLNQP